MKRILMFTMASCPHCQRALQWMSESNARHPGYRAIPIEIIDETVHPETAEQYDYYYVPTFYLDGVKVHEGVATPEIVEDILARAAE